MQTTEGVKPLLEAIATLKATAPLEPMEAKEGMQQAAADHVKWVQQSSRTAVTYFSPSLLLSFPAFSSSLRRLLRPCLLTRPSSTSTRLSPPASTRFCLGGGGIRRRVSLCGGVR